MSDAGDNFVIAGSGGVLKNRKDATTHDDLARALAQWVPRGRTTIFQGAPAWTFDEAFLRAIHKTLFGDVFEWAGRTRDERVTLLDGTVATAPFLRRPLGTPFMLGPLIGPALKELFADLRRDSLLTNLDRTTFANKAAEAFARLNSIHPFRDGNGRTQRTLFSALAIAAGHSLDFRVLSAQRNEDVSILASNGDLEPMRRLFREIVDPVRIAAIVKAKAALVTHRGYEFWNEQYMATTEPGQTYAGVKLVGMAGTTFMASAADNSILVGWVADLPVPHPARGETFGFTAGAPPSEA